MTRRMLINALYPEECRVAVADDDLLLELEVERADLSLLKGNVYKAPITRIEPSLQAAFLDIGSNRNGFLQINDINPSYYLDWDPENSERGRPAIQDVLRPHQELVVQVVKDERAAKGATLTTNLSIPGRYLVLMVGNQRGGVSRKIVDEGQRRRLRQAVQSLKIPAGMGVIVRTAGINKSSVELQRDLDALLDLWNQIVEKSLSPGGPILLYKESNLSIRTIRDYLTPDIDEILIDEPGVYDNAREFIRKIIPSFEPRVKYFDKPQPLFSTYHLDGQVEETNQPEVTLPSGGSIVINVTEAIVAIDVNSGRSTGQSDVEETAFETNKEAAVTIAKQLRLRDLGGLIVIDFIDMIDRRHKQIVEKALKDAVRFDKAKVEIGRISKFGLLEMSRQRLKSSLVSQSHTVCPHCSGRGRVKTAESAALEALRKIQSAVFAGGVEQIRVHMAPAAALLLLNNKRQIISQFESATNTNIIIYADGRKKPEEYDMELITHRQHEEHGEIRTTRYTEREDQDRRNGRRQRGGQDSRRSSRPQGGGQQQQQQQQQPQQSRSGRQRRGKKDRRRRSGRPQRGPGVRPDSTNSGSEPVESAPRAESGGGGGGGGGEEKPKAVSAPRPAPPQNGS